MSTPRNPDSGLPVPIFILHADEDAPRNNDILLELIELLRDRGKSFFHLWSSQDLKPGDEKAERRREALENAKIVLLFVTDSFLNSQELLEESSTAFDSRGLKQNIVVPVILTDSDWSGQPFAALVPIKPSLGESLYGGSGVAQKIYDALVDLMETRINGTEKSPKTTPKTTSETASENNSLNPQQTGLDFQSIWLYCFLLLFVSLLAMLVWFSFNPAARNIKPSSSPSPFSFFFGSLVIGIAAMSMIQVARRLFRIRGAFHRSCIIDWLGDSGTRQLYQEVGHARIKDLFDLPSELLTGQLAAIAEKVMEHQAKNEPKTPLIAKMAGIPEKWEIRASENTVDREVNTMLAIQRNLDQFQISSSANWRRYLLLTSVLLSMVIFVLGLPLLQTGSFISGLSNPDGLQPLKLSQRTGNFALLFSATLLTGLFAGFLGSIARDLVAIIEKLRR